MAKHTRLGAALIILLAAGVVTTGCGPEEDAQGAAGTSYSVPLGRESATPAVTVRMRDFGYAPRRVRIRTGESVRFTDDDRAPHTATAEQHAAGTFETGRVRTGRTRPVVFTKRGRYPYYCRFHPFMVGTVEVVH